MKGIERKEAKERKRTNGSKRTKQKSEKMKGRQN